MRLSIEQLLYLSVQEHIIPWTAAYRDGQWQQSKHWADRLDVYKGEEICRSPHNWTSLGTEFSLHAW